MAALADLMYQLGQLFLAPVLVLIVLLFGYVCHAGGRFAWQLRRRRVAAAGAGELMIAARTDPGLDLQTLELLAARRLEPLRLTARTAPMLGLIATMIPMGPALQALGTGELADVAQELTVAFSAVILSLLTAAPAHVIVQVRRRWYLDELYALERARDGDPS